MDPKIIEEIKRRNKLKMQQWEDRLKIGKIGKGHDDETQAPAADPSASGSLNDFLDKTPEQTQAAPSPQPQRPAQPAPQPSADAEDPAMARFDIGPADPSRIDLSQIGTPSAPRTEMQATASRPAQPSATPPSAAEHSPALPDNIKQLHIDIIDGKIKISRKNISMEQSLNLLAKIYNSYKKKLKK
jgi:hypothetical protein